MSSPGPDRPTLVHTLPDLAIGGGQQLLEATLAGMGTVAPRYHHLVVSVAGGAMEDRLRAVGADVQIAPPWLLPKLARDLRRRGVALVHSNNTWQDRLVAQTLATILRVPTLNTLHGIAPERSARGPRRALNRLMIRRIAHHVAVGPAAARSYAAALDLPSERISVIEACLAKDRFEPADPAAVATLRRELVGSPGQTLLVSVGRLVKGKNPELLVEAVADLRQAGRDVRLVLVGDGPLREKTARVAESLGVSADVIFLGMRHDVGAILEASDVFVTASETEGFGLTVLEAMAKGLPVVGFDIEGYESFAIDGETAWLAPLFDVPALAAAIGRVIDDPEHRATVVAAAGQRADTHRPEARAAAQAEIYDRLLNRTGEPLPG